MSGLKHHEGRTDYRKILDQMGDREFLRILYYKPIYKDVSETFKNFLSSISAEVRQTSKKCR